MRSSLNDFCPALSIISSIVGMLNGACLVSPFTFLMSVHIHTSPLGLGMATIGKAQGLSDRTITSN